MLRPFLVLIAAAAIVRAAAPAPSAPRAPADAAHPSWDIALIPPGEPGRPFEIDGTLYGLPDSLPVHDATLYLYHADARGNYGPQGDAKPRLHGTLRTNITGGFRVRTVLPGMYDGLPHVHYQVSGPGLESRFGAATLARRNGAGSDSAYNRVPWMLELPAGWIYAEPSANGGYRATWKLYVRRR